MIVYNYDADLEVSDTCVRSSLLSFPGNFDDTTCVICPVGWTPRGWILVLVGWFG